MLGRDIPFVFCFFFFKSRISEDLSAYIHPEDNAMQDYSCPGSLLCLSVMELTGVM